MLIVVDRRDPKTQLSDDLDACDYPHVERALGDQDLKRRLRTDWRGTFVTTIQSFQQMDDLGPLPRDNIVSMVDECHRSQTASGRGSRDSDALTMPVKLQNGSRFGFTGTPIGRTLQKPDHRPVSVSQRQILHHIPHPTNYESAVGGDWFRPASAGVGPNRKPGSAQGQLVACTDWLEVIRTRTSTRAGRFSGSLRS